ncbi:hypothetical protein KDN24_08710 [Bacillus sp. Bva_UNVM-123]|uniref:hypothetical protein n=1 Tax=Bacillus sp. Bva_UNVM-123 TaxID=2829798 RepID=UPI00391EE87D
MEDLEMKEYSFEDLKSSLETGNLIKSAKIIMQLFMFHKDFRKGLLLSGCLPEPLSREFSQEKLNKFLRLCQHLEQEFQKFDKEFDDDNAISFKETYFNVVATIHFINKFAKENEKRLLKNDFLSYPFTKQIQMLCTFIENQSRYAGKEVSKKIVEKGYITGLEQAITSEENLLSIEDNLENTVEIFDTLFRFLHFNSKGKIEKSNFEVYSDISPYKIPSVEELLLLSLHRNSLESLWEKVKYSQWDFIKTSIEDKSVLYFIPPNDEALKVQISAIHRYKYKAFINMAKLINKINEAEYKTIQSIIDKFEFSLENPESLFNINTDIFIKVGKIIDINIKGLYEDLSETYGSTIVKMKFGKSRKIPVEDFLKGIKFLKVFAYIYSNKSHDNIDDKNEQTFCYLAPVFELDVLINKFLEIFKFGKNKATEIIELLVFKPNSKLDVFSQPLIYVGNNHVVFTPYLIEQLNIARMVEQQIIFWKVKDIEKGIEFEKTLRFMLSVLPHININPESIEFQAYDGRDVEYDVIGTFEGRLLLIEIKSIKRQFSPYEFKKREEDVLNGVNQVNRRERIAKKQWEVIKERATINLPETCPGNIIKIVCLNTLDFTGSKYGDVYITDISALTKFFMDPVIKYKTIQPNHKANNQVVQRLWSSSKPNIDDLIRYLEKPVAMRNYYNNLEELPRLIMQIEESKIVLAMKDYIITEDPFEYEGNKIRKKKRKKKRRKKHKNKK